MKKFLKWAGIVSGVLAALVAIASVFIYSKSRARLTRVYDVPDEAVAIPADEASVARGRHIFQLRGCEACHSTGGYLNLSQAEQALDAHLSLPVQDIPHMEGNLYLDDPAVGQVVASNLTSGKGGVGSEYADRDLRGIQQPLFNLWQVPVLIYLSYASG